MPLRNFIGCVAVLGVIALTSQVHPVAQSPQVAGFQDVVVISGLTMPTAVRFSPDGRVFVAEKSGLIKIFSNLSDTQPTIFSDIRTEVHNFWDRGLLGLALDPQFPTEPYVYVLYTRDAPIGGTAPRWGTAGQTSDGCPTPPGATQDGCAVSGRLARLKAAGNVMTGPMEVLVDGWFQQFPSHSIGSIAFDASGALYASGGEGASFQFVDYGQRGNPGGDPPVPAGGTQTAPTAEGGSLRAQDLRTSGDPVGLSGSVIRVDRRTGAPLPDNPLFSNPDINARRIVAYGFRNPFRITTRPGTSEVWVGDVGWQLFDEINRIVDPRAGVRNFGWPCYEGPQKHPGWDAANLNICEDLYAETGAVTFPLFEYKQGSAIVTGEACPVTDAALSGLAFYEGGSYPAQYNGALFFADYARRCVWAMLPDASGVPDRTKISTFLVNAGFPVDLQIGPNGDLFYVDFDEGTIHRIQFMAGNQPPRAVASATPDAGQAPLSVSFDGSASTDPDNGGALTYSWDLDGNGTFGDSTAVNPTHTYTVSGTYVVRLRVTDVAGLTDTTSVTVVAGNARPTATIDTPASTLRWRVGQSVSFSGHATDPEDGSLGASAFVWSLVMHHCSTPTSCHTHPIQDFAGVTGGSFTAPDHEYPSFLELRLTVTDSGGLTAVQSVRLDPQTVTLTFDSSPRGFRLGVMSDVVITPRPVTVIVGSAISISAPSPQPGPDGSYEFVSWSDGGAQTHTVTAGATPQTFTATFRLISTIGTPEIVLYVKRAAIRAGTWRFVADSAAAGGQRLEQPDAGVPLIATPLASPAHYVEVTFDAEAGRGYRLWLRGRAQADSSDNDSVYVQFDGSVTSTGAPVNRIGSSQATPVRIEDCSGCGVSGWGWADNGYGTGVLGPLVRFAATGRQTMRIQAREDGVSLDQIVLSSSIYLKTAPGAMKNDTTILPETVPQPVDVTLDSVPRGLQLKFGAETVTTPATRSASAGSTMTIAAPSPQTLAGTPHTFVSWSDGGAQTHAITVGSAPQTFTATYKSAAPSDEVVVYASKAVIKAGTWRVVPDTTAAGEQRLEQPDAGAPKVTTPLAVPAHYVEVTFDAQAGRGYRLWLRGRAQANSYNNDSVYVQFDGSVTASGAPVNRIGSTQATPVIIEDCANCGVSGWGWADNGYGAGVLGPLVYFATTGRQTMRIQAREDGISLDQIVLSSSTYLNAAPGATKNDTTILPER